MQKFLTTCPNCKQDISPMEDDSEWMCPYCGAKVWKLVNVHFLTHDEALVDVITTWANDNAKIHLINRLTEDQVINGSNHEAVIRILEDDKELGDLVDDLYQTVCYFILNRQ